MRKALLPKPSISRHPICGTSLGFIGLTDVTFIHAENQLREQGRLHPLRSRQERIDRVRSLIRRSATSRLIDERNTI